MIEDGLSYGASTSVGCGDSCDSWDLRDALEDGSGRGESGLEDSRVRGVQKYDKMRREIC